MSIKDHMIELNKKLIEASHVYYNEDREIMSNYEYDALYDELYYLERIYGIPYEGYELITDKVGVKVVSSLEKVKHSIPMLSLSKTKSIEELKTWVDNKKVCASWKLDGLTVVITYENGKLTQAATRGDGEIGEDITKQALHFSGVPHRIPIKDKLVIRGEAIIDYKEFDRINSINDAESKFKNPRNLVSGTVKNLDLSIFEEREVRWFPFDVIEGHDAVYKWVDKECSFEIISKTVGDIEINANSYSFYLDALWTLGFDDVVEHKIIEEKELKEFIENCEDIVKRGKFIVPVDGLVFAYDDIKYSQSLGSTSHSPRGSIAFKWQDETYDTVLKEIEWSKSRTGRINPVAIFDPVEIDGTTVSRASLHNLTYIEDMRLNIGDEVTVYKANMIIPQIAENKTKSLKNIKDILPNSCPVCSGDVEINKEGNSSFLYCTNKQCNSNLVDNITLFLDQMKVMGISKTTINKLVEQGIIDSVPSIFGLKNHKEEFCNIEGLGENIFNSVVTQIDNIETDLATFIASLGIFGVNRGVSKLLAEKYKTFDNFLKCDIDSLSSINGIGDKISESIVEYVKKNNKDNKMKEFSNNVTIREYEEITNDNEFISGKVFAITGSVNIFNNRKEFQEFVEKNSGKVGSVNSKTNYLVTNDTTSGSSKNKKAKELGVEIITEEEFVIKSGYQKE